jgi:hypothetical protein
MQGRLCGIHIEQALHPDPAETAAARAASRRSRRRPRRRTARSAHPPVLPRRTHGWSPPMRGDDDIVIGEYQEAPTSLDATPAFVARLLPNPPSWIGRNLGSRFRHLSNTTRGVIGRRVVHHDKFRVTLHIPGTPTKPGSVEVLRPVRRWHDDAQEGPRDERSADRFDMGATLARPRPVCCRDDSSPLI